MNEELYAMMHCTMENQLWKHLLQHRIALVGLNIQFAFKGKHFIIIVKNYTVRNQNYAIKQWLSVEWCKLGWQSQNRAAVIGQMLLTLTGHTRRRMCETLVFVLIILQMLLAFNYVHRFQHSWYFL